MSATRLLSSRVLLLALLSLLQQSVAWGPRFDPLKGAFFRGHALEVSASNYNDDETVLIEEYRARLNTLFHTDVYENTFESLAFLRDRADDLATETFAENAYYCGDECEEECLIPEAWKEMEEDLDIMDFLGIQRAQPIAKISPPNHQ